MDIGSFLISWATVPMILSMAGYLLVAVGMREFKLSSRIVYWLFFGMAFVAFLDLFRLFMTDQFQYSYITSYSSSDLSNSWPHFYKISALWAGQQGTFLLWLVFGLVLGFWVKAKAKENEGWVMFFYILGQTFLLVLTIISNPFEKLGFLPLDGQGLNPLLQNYWMQIHPPIVFIGFAAACIPFAFAMAALATNKYDDWVKQTMPWVVFTVATLGLGIFLGGYWAYETLGWGGYWAWDPVENASLIPWLVSVALVHGMVVEKSRGTWRRTNLFLAITMFLLIVYGTFLTRSGVLADFSVHSFVDLGYNNVLWGSIVVLGLIAYSLWAYRAARMKVATQAGTPILSQEFTTFLSMVLLLPFTMLVLFWTSFPLITTIMSGIPLLSKIAPTPAAIGQTNYNIAGLIFSVIFSIILGFNALLGWRDTDKAALKKKLMLPVLISLVSSILFIVLGYSKIAQTWSTGPQGGSGLVIIMAILYFLFFATAVFAVITNLLMMIRRIKSSFLLAGGFMTHFGYSLMLIGIIFSSSFGELQKSSISTGETRQVLDYEVTFKGMEQSAPKEKSAYFELIRGDNSFQAISVSKEMRRGEQIQYVRTPHVEKSLLSDLYLSAENITEPNQHNVLPLELEAGESVSVMGLILQFDGYDSDKRALELGKARGQTFEVTKGQSISVNGESITFVEFDMSQHEGGMGSGIGAKLNVTYKGKTSTVVPTFSPTQSAPEAVKLPSGDYVTVMKINADIGGVILSIGSDNANPDIEVGAVVNIIRDADTSIVVPVFNPSAIDSEKATATLPDGSILTLTDVHPSHNAAMFTLGPPQLAQVATIALSTKPMINLVWFGFLLICIGATLAVLRRMAEARKRS
ncbi:MAG: cytochrome c biogenesis protein CcsA [candidate division Zixibacteria bacterium]